jgi:hypothetical protein
MSTRCRLVWSESLGIGGLRRQADHDVKIKDSHSLCVDEKFVAVRTVRVDLFAAEEVLQSNAWACVTAPIVRSLSKDGRITCKRSTWKDRSSQIVAESEAVESKVGSSVVEKAQTTSWLLQERRSEYVMPVFTGGESRDVTCIRFERTR